MIKKIWVLLVTQSLSTSIGPLVVLVAGILGYELSPSPLYSTFPIACFIIGLAFNTIPVTLSMKKFGRKKVFIFGNILGIFGAVAAGYSIYLENFYAFCFSNFLLGGSITVAQQYRFAAIEKVSKEDTGKAASFVLLGGLVAAFIGPELVSIANSLSKSLNYTFKYTHFILSYLLFIPISIVSIIIFILGYNNTYLHLSKEKSEIRPFKSILINPGIILAILSSAVGYAIMSFLMTATPLNMHKIQGHSLENTKWIIQSHIIAMFLPSFFSGILISYFGPIVLISIGTGVYLCCLLIASSGHQLLHYFWALVLLGIGWNFMFVGGTSLLPSYHRPEEKFKVQTLNESIVFGLQAIASLSSGWVIYNWGWQSLVRNCMVLLTCFSVLLIFVFQKEKKIRTTKKLY